MSEPLGIESLNLKDFLEDGGSHSTAAPPVVESFRHSKATKDILRLKNKFSFDTGNKRVTTISEKALALVLFQL